MHIKTLSIKHLEADFKKSEGYEKLNKGQREFFSHVFKGENVFITGPAGTGKSYCIDFLFKYLASKAIFIGKTAMTGVAALNIGGSTIHSWAGLGLAEEDVDSVVRNANKNKRARERMQHTSILFIDEISMASADILNKIDAVLKHVRYSPKPFGGIQIIFSGDLLQLPPVFRGQGDEREFCFKSEAWLNGNVNTVHLEKLVRQDENTPFAKLLQKLRFGEVKDYSILEKRVNAPLDCTTEPIRLFCKNLDIDLYNNGRYSQLNAQEKTFICRDLGGERFTAFFDKNCPAPRILRLKIGAQVMLLTNVDVKAGLVNGAIGIVEGFNNLGPIVKFNNGEKVPVDINKWEVKEQELDITGKMRYKVVATREQIPLKLAYATSVHKSQGQTLDYAVVDVSNAFECGQIYTALSRLRTLEGLRLEGFNPHRIKAHPECVEFYKNLKKKK